MRIFPDVVFVFWIFNLQDENGCCCCGYYFDDLLVR